VPPQSSKNSLFWMWRYQAYRWRQSLGKKEMSPEDEIQQLKEQNEELLEEIRELESCERRLRIKDLFRDKHGFSLEELNIASGYDGAIFNNTADE
jgi:cell division protein FtsL